MQVVVDSEWLTAIRAEAKAAVREPWANCDGSFVCESVWHVHGCYADDGQCDDPKDHHAGVRDEAKTEALAPIRALIEEQRRTTPVASASPIDAGIRAADRDWIQRLTALLDGGEEP